MVNIIQRLNISGEWGDGLLSMFHWTGYDEKYRAKNKWFYKRYGFRFLGLIKCRYFEVTVRTTSLQ